MDPIIYLESVSKEFRVYEKRTGKFSMIKNLINPISKEINAVENLSFSVNKGEMVGYVGPNGAGKSTTIKLLTGILLPTNGEILVCGRVPYKNRILNSSQIGVVFGQKSQLWWDVPVIDSFKLLKEIYNISNSKFNQNLSIYSEVLGLKDLLHVPVRQLSLGQRMRCDLAASLLHDPKILFLDEPTIGLDVATKDRLRQFIRSMNESKDITVILTTHDMKDIEEICNRIIIINKGQKVYDGNLRSVKEYYAPYQVLEVVFYNNISENSLEELYKMDGIINVKREDSNKKAIKFDSRQISSATILEYLFKKFNIIDCSITNPSIEDIIKSFKWEA